METVSAHWLETPFWSFLDILYLPEIFHLDLFDLPYLLDFLDFINFLYYPELRDLQDLLKP